MADSSEPEPPSLVAVYLQRRDDLKRYFTLRLRSAEAAEDLVQDIYVKLAGGVAGEILNPGAFLYRLGTTLMLDRLKQQRRAHTRARGGAESGLVSLEGGAVADIAPADEAMASRQRLLRM